MPALAVLSKDDGMLDSTEIMRYSTRGGWQAGCVEINMRWRCSAVLEKMLEIPLVHHPATVCIFSTQLLHRERITPASSIRAIANLVGDGVRDGANHEGAGVDDRRPAALRSAVLNA